MADIQRGELQDNLGNVIYPHTEADLVFCADGESVQEKLVKTEDALGNVTGTTDSLEVSDPNILVSSVATKTLSNTVSAMLENMGEIEIRFGTGTLSNGAETILFEKEMSSNPIVLVTGISPATVNVLGLKVHDVSTAGFSVVGTYVTGSGNISMSTAEYMWLAICKK